jgi:single-stranded-DNA-specific exonuclease
MQKRWTIYEPDDSRAVNELAKELNISPLLARLLVLRGVNTFDSAKDFFRPSLEHLHHPFLMRDMDKAIARIEKAINENEKVLIYGDYDVDGTTAVALVYSYFKSILPRIDFYIPDRYSEGYGISFQGVDFAAANDFKLIIALDCGIKANDKVDYANTKGVDFIICDHHLPGEKLPEAHAILNPKVPGCNYPYKELSGCGIGFKLAQGFAERNNRDREELYALLDFVAVSIAADIVPITGENRVMAYFGMKYLNLRKRKGFDALLNLSNFAKELTVSDIVFTIAPRINAAGRLTSGKKAVELLISETPDTAFAQSEAINQTNSERRSLDKSITEHALSLIEQSENGSAKKSTVVFHPEWHKGVVGIVASRLIEKYYRPTIVLTESNGVLTGSARSVKNFDVYSAIESCSDLLHQFGGHKYAAGLTLPKENFEKFVHRFEEAVSDSISDELLVPEVEIDAEVNLHEIDDKFYRILKQFAPFGPGNLKPVLKAVDLQEKGYARIVGTNHLKMDLHERKSGISFPAIAFNQGESLSLARSGKPLQACFAVEENEYNGNISLQLNVKDFRG